MRQALWVRLHKKLRRCAVALVAALRAEFDAQAACLGGLPPLKRLPGRLLVRERFAGPERGAFEAMARKAEQEWSAALGARAERVPGAGHYLQRERPDAVAAAIRSVLGELK